MTAVRESQLVDWRTSGYLYGTVADGGRLGTALAWGKPPEVGQVVILRSAAPGSPGVCYRVTALRPAWTDVRDGFTVDLEHVPGELVEMDGTR